ncbi:pseudouridine synthase [Cantharellus anzutake]|uniref:pseudouridine synthase n=1 Tax=Cantharellus anzutake TaxID=1750568 RepID=UPI001903C033|nr:pseudouridine synthase [Cantharellus anzutake]KAF8343859.1 pseudouridine synthase [Cantharellus anzutake]
MPRVPNQKYPLDGVFGLIKPSGPPSMVLLDRMKPLLWESPLFVTREEDRRKNQDMRLRSTNRSKKRHKQYGSVKVGQGGTLDPLADGVLVVGINKGTKSLSQFLNCAKEYYATAILGCETDTYDSEGAVVRRAPFAHVTPEKLSAALGAFRGSISQLPPIYSALKMDGKPLYEYARSGTPLPRPIEARQATIHDIELVGWQDAADGMSPGHAYSWPTKHITEAQRASFESIQKLILAASSISAATSPSPSEPVLPGATIIDSAEEELGKSSTSKAPVFTLRMRVSSGTYVRSIVHDLAHSVGSAAHIVRLTRTRQGDFAEGTNYFNIPGPLHNAKLQENTAAEAVEAEPNPLTTAHGNCIPWDTREGRRS